MRAVDRQCTRVRIVITGAVQGVGFRPYIYRLAKRYHLGGWVRNSVEGVVVEIEGDPKHIERFMDQVIPRSPPLSIIRSISSQPVPITGDRAFKVVASGLAGEKKALVLPDIATCPQCLQDISDPANRRYRYPFTNCTNCGPRFSIIRKLPYDRPHTTMIIFTMCDACREEYENPEDRRFHAQPIACPECGPQVELVDATGVKVSGYDHAIKDAASTIRRGTIVAIKGLGGFHLVVDAKNSDAVSRLRRQKNREEKPLALMYPSLEMIEEHCHVSSLERRLLQSYQSPIVLLRRRRDNLGQAEAGSPSEMVAPGNPYLGVMLPYTPLHHILMEALGSPIVATSGNISDEPICIDNHEALERLSGIADLFLMHNRPIERYVDDSVVHVVGGREQILRRARGYAPLPIVGAGTKSGILAVGAQQKNAVAVSIGGEVFSSQHIGDLETTLANNAFTHAVTDLLALYENVPRAVAHDAHPDYESTKFSQTLEAPPAPVQHHYAHVLSCMLDNDITEEVLGISWDGTGYGSDGTIWGGEFLRADPESFTRSAHLMTFRLPGGETAIREPRRSAIGLLYEVFDHNLDCAASFDLVPAFRENEFDWLCAMLEKGINSPETSSAGRLFDAVAAIIGVRQVCSFEGQAAMELESMAHTFKSDHCYDFSIMEGITPRVLDWRPMILQILGDLSTEVSPAEISAEFHNTLVEMMVEEAHLAGIEKVVLSGGCFQNRYLSDRAIYRLKAEGFTPIWHRNIPPNDGGIAFGQIVAASSGLKEE